MVDAISGGIGGIKAAIEAVKGLNATITEAKVAEAKMTIINHLITAQQALLDNQATLLANTDDIRALEAEIRTLGDWSVEAAAYEPADTGQGARAYRLKGASAASEAEIWLCPNCFHNRKKSFLQPETLAVGRTHILRCHPCGQEIITRGVRQEPVPQRRR